MDERLTKTQWLERGLQTLASEGFQSLKAAPLAKSLNVSRGSFYWHFKDIATFRRAVLELWRTKTTLQVIDDLDSQSTPQERLKELVLRAGRAEFHLERSVRAWASVDDDAATVVEGVDLERIQFISELLVAMQMPRQKASDRARILYWAYLGKNMTVFNSKREVDDTTFGEALSLVLG